MILVGTATCGRAAGALEVLQAVKEVVKKQNLNCLIYEVGCLGHCYAEPLLIIRKPGYPPICYGHVSTVLAENLIHNFIVNDDPSLSLCSVPWKRTISSPVSPIFPAQNMKSECFEKLRSNQSRRDRALYRQWRIRRSGQKHSRCNRRRSVEEIKRSQLRGLGGAGFPAGEKWEVCRRSQGEPKYLICNGDEGDPGAFMDRAILESDPHSVLEGMIIAAYAIGARHGYIYVRAEYPLAVKRIQVALRQAEEMKLLGENILGSGFSFDIKLFQVRALLSAARQQP